MYRAFQKLKGSEEFVDLYVLQSSAPIPPTDRWEIALATSLRPIRACHKEALASVGLVKGPRIESQPKQSFSPSKHR